MPDTSEAAPVFLSYSHKDKQWAEDITTALKSRGIQCWVDHQSMMAGEKFRASILEGISKAKVMVVILSDHANASKYVEIEVGHAVSGELVIIPCRIQDSPLKGGLKFSLDGIHSLDVFHPPKEEKIRQLVDTVERILGRSPATSSYAQRPQWSWWQRFKRVAMKTCLILVAVSVAILALKNCGGNIITSFPPLPNIDSKPTIENMGVTYEIKDWGWEGDKLVFWIVATNHKATTQIQFGRCGIWDDTDNNTNRSQLIKDGQIHGEPDYATLYLPSEVRTTFGLQFYGVSPKAKMIRLFQIGLSSLAPMSFRDIPIEGRKVSSSSSP